MAEHILLIDGDPATSKQVSSVLIQAGLKVTACQNSQEVLGLLDTASFNLVVLDVIVPDDDGYEMIRRLRQHPLTANIPIILLTSLDSLEHKLKGFEAGADDYLQKPCPPNELVARLNVWLRHTALERLSLSNQLQGSVLAVHSLRGGVGVSSIAANLAVGLAQLWGRPVALLDLDLFAGQAALMLNLPVRNSWSDITPVPAAEIRRELVCGLLRPHLSGVHVLPAPARITDAELIDIDQVTQVMDILRQEYDYVVLDLPHDFAPHTLVGLDNASHVIALLAPDLASVRTMSSALSVFASLGYPPEKIHLVLNSIFERGGLQKIEIEAVLNHKIMAIIPNDSEGFVRAINLGRPVALDSLTSPLGAFFEELAFRLSKDEHRRIPPQQPSPAWQRVAARLRQRQQR